MLPVYNLLKTSGQRENLMRHSTASAAGQLEHWLTACREILMTSPQNSSAWGSGPHLIHGSSGPAE